MRVTLLYKKRYVALIYVIISVVFVFSFLVALLVGRYKISVATFFKLLFSKAEYEIERSIIFNLRLPRTIVAALTGIALSVSGLLYQETFQNKLVSPDLLGVSSGAGVGAAIAIVLGLSSVFVSVFVFGFGILTVVITLFVATAFRNKSSTVLTLSGIIVGGCMSCFIVR